MLSTIARFLSTLSLRRATVSKYAHNAVPGNFYPRSPCGERRKITLRNVVLTVISIHALLAESDYRSYNLCSYDPRFLSTLSLRRATDPISSTSDIYKISIHALLAESDDEVNSNNVETAAFLSTLSLRRATHFVLTMCSR